MSLRFSADEIFEMAIQIEVNGAVFYRKAAGMQGAGRSADFLLKLAVMEDGHKKTFEKMRQELTAPEKEVTTYDPLEEASLYLAAMADGHGGEGSPAAAGSLTGKETLAEILRTAIGLEKKSILFYLGMRDLVPLAMGKRRIDAVIGEEKSHIVILSRELNAIKTA
jgi:rubrerythrin